MKKDDRKRLRDHISSLVDQLSPLQILEDAGISTQLVGNKTMALCPFHDDKNIGSFIVTDRYFKCFSCGEKGGAPSLYAKLMDISFKEAFAELAAVYDLAPLTDIVEAYGYKPQIDANKTFVAKQASAVSTPEAKTDEATINKNDKIYRIYLDMITLSDEDKAYLLSRGLTQDIITKRLYRSVPKYFAMVPFLTRIQKALGSVDVIKDCPGFYFDPQKLLYQVKVAYGILIPIYDAKGRIRAMQIRRDSDEGLRYVWFTGTKHGGVSAGTPVDFIRPKKEKSPAIFITEGRFKSEAIVSKLGRASISVQGIGNWASISEVLTEVPEGTTFCIAYDMECSEANPGAKKLIEKHVENLKNYLIENGHTVFRATWNPKYKGIDDALENGAEIEYERMEP